MEGSDLQSLRQLALNRTINALHREAVCLDEDAAAQLRTLEQALTELRVKREQRLAQIREGHGDQRMAADPLADLDQLITDTETDLERQRDAAKDQTIVFVFGRLAPKAYDDLLAEHQGDDGKLKVDEFYNALAAKTFRRVETPDGRDLDVTWEQAVDGILTHGDREKIHAETVAHNRKATVIPFSRRGSGKG